LIAIVNKEEIALILPDVERGLRQQPIEFVDDCAVPAHRLDHRSWAIWPTPSREFGNEVAVSSERPFQSAPDNKRLEALDVTDKVSDLPREFLSSYLSNYDDVVGLSIVRAVERLQVIRVPITESLLADAWSPPSDLAVMG